MSKKLLIDAAHVEETRVAVVEDTCLEEFDSEHFSFDFTTEIVFKSNSSTGAVVSQKLFKFIDIL